MKLKTFSVTEAISYGFFEFKQKPLLYASVALTHTILTTLLPFVLQDLANSQMVANAGFLYQFVLQAFNLVLQIWGSLVFSISVTYFFLKIVDHPRTKYEIIFKYHRNILSYLSLLIRIYVRGILLLLCFIIPGIIWLTKCSFALYFLLDQKLTAKEAIQKSHDLTKGNLLKLIGFGIVISLLGFIPVAFSSIVASIMGLRYTELLSGSMRYAGFALSSIFSLVLFPVYSLSSVYIYKTLQGKKVSS